jgi:hypothetical protein
MSSMVSLSFKQGGKCEIAKLTSQEVIERPTAEKVAAYIKALREAGFTGNIRFPRDMAVRPFVVEKEEFVPVGPQLLLG